MLRVLLSLAKSLLTSQVKIQNAVLSLVGSCYVSIVSSIAVVCIYTSKTQIHGSWPCSMVKTKSMMQEIITLTLTTRRMASNRLLVFCPRPQSIDTKLCTYNKKTNAKTAELLNAQKRFQ
jgi:hypothetical protein